MLFLPPPHLLLLPPLTSSFRPCRRRAFKKSGQCCISFLRRCLHQIISNWCMNILKGENMSRALNVLWHLSFEPAFSFLIYLDDIICADVFSSILFSSTATATTTKKRLKQSFSLFGCCSLSIKWRIMKIKSQMFSARTEIWDIYELINLNRVCQITHVTLSCRWHLSSLP